MPVIGFALVAGLARYVLSAVGVGIVTYVGVNALLSQATQMIKSSLGSTGDVAGFAGLMGIDVAISLILSGYSIRLTLSTLKRFKVL